MRISMRLNSIEEAERWVLGWGIHATVIRPRALAKRMRQTSRSLLDGYDTLLAESQSADESYPQNPGSGLLSANQSSCTNQASSYGVIDPNRDQFLEREIRSKVAEEAEPEGAGFK